MNHRCIVFVCILIFFYVNKCLKINHKQEIVVPTEIRKYRNLVIFIFKKNTSNTVFGLVIKYVYDLIT